MRGRKTALIAGIDDGTREQLVSWLEATKTPVGLAKRAWAMLLAVCRGKQLCVGGCGALAARSHLSCAQDRNAVRGTQPQPL